LDRAQLKVFNHSKANVDIAVHGQLHQIPAKKEVTINK